MDEKIKRLLDEQYKKLENNLQGFNSRTKINILNNIIEIKNDNQEIRNHNRQLTVDIKIFIDWIIDLHESAALGYDTYNVQQFSNLIRKLTYTEKKSLTSFFIRKLKLSGFENRLDDYQKLKKELEIAEYRKKWYLPSNFALLIISLPTLSLTYLIFELVIFFTIYVIFTLPAISDTFILYRIEYSTYESNFLVNHVLNIIADLVGLETSFKVLPMNVFGVILGALGRLLFISIVVKYLISKFLDYLPK